MARLLQLFALLALHPALGLIAAESLHLPNSTPERTCPEGKGLFEGVCCDFCPPGMVVNYGCTDNIRVTCKYCTKEKEYMDEKNLNHKCRRCSSCDTEHGMEVEENCTIYQNVKCRCKPDFFCNSEQCQYCSPCTKCKEGTVKECTPTKDAECSSKGNLLWLCAIPVVLLLMFLIWCYWRKRSKKEYSVPPHISDEECIEMQACFPDIDLSPHISDIATEMTKDQVLMFVRKLGIQQGTIDTVCGDNVNNTAEQKIGLLQKWYEQNGVQGAHEKLINTLRQVGLRRTADNIEQKLKQ